MSPATAGAAPPTTPSDTATAQYVEVVPSATGVVPMGEPVRAAHAAALPPAVRARVEKTVGTDAFLLLNIAQDPGLAGSRGFLLVAMPIAITTAGVAYTIRSRSRRRCGRGLFRAL